jgi:hypothetical protein
MHEDLEPIANLRYGEVVERVTRENGPKLNAALQDLAARGLSNSGMAISTRLNWAVNNAEQTCRGLYEIWLQLILQRNEGRLTRADVDFIIQRIRACTEARSGNITQMLTMGGAPAADWAVQQAQGRMQAVSSAVSRELEIKFREQQAFTKRAPVSAPPPAPVAVQPSDVPRVDQWFTYYWLACKRFGAECYHTWRAELFASVVVSLFIYLLSLRENRGAWKDFRTALLATAFTLGSFALWHLVRIPWLTHQQVTSREDIAKHWGFGVLGVTVMAALLFGSYSLASLVLEMRAISVAIKIPAPTGPQITLENPTKVVTRTVTVPAKPYSENSSEKWKPVRGEIARRMADGQQILSMATSLQAQPALSAVADKWMTETSNYLASLDRGFASSFSTASGFSFTTSVTVNGQSKAIPDVNQNVVTAITYKLQALDQILKQVPVY